MRYTLGLFLLAFVAAERPALPAVSDLKPDEEVTLFPAIGRKVERLNRAQSWEIEVRGCVYEPEPRRWTLAALAKSLDLGGVSLTAGEEALLAERARLFMVDNERRKRVVVRWEGHEFDLGRSARDGRFSGKVRIPATEVGSARTIELEAVLPGGDPRKFTCPVTLLDETGLTVISDIDDTIKLTGVSSARSILRATFLEPFAPVPGMAGLYQRLDAKLQARFLYVSASPWQLYPVFADFLKDEGFPKGVFFLKHFRPKDRSLAALFTDPMEYKLGILEPVLKSFPGRGFILVGDSGERDPEIYLALAGKYPGQVAQVWIRDTTGEPAGSARYRRLAASVRPGVLRVFSDPSELAGIEESLAKEMP